MALRKQPYVKRFHPKWIKGCDAGWALRFLRQLQGLRTEELGERMKVTRQYVNKLEKGRVMSIEMALRASEALDVPIDALVLFGRAAWFDRNVRRGND